MNQQLLTAALISDEDQAAIDKLAELTVWTRDSDVGDYSIALPFEPAPENVPREGVPVGQNDNGARSADSSMRNWVLANMHMAEVLKEKGYAYQFVYAQEAGHVDRLVRGMSLAPALEWLWKDYLASK